MCIHLTTPGLVFLVDLEFLAAIFELIRLLFSILLLMTQGRAVKILAHFLILAEIDLPIYRKNNLKKLRLLLSIF